MVTVQNFSYYIAATKYYFNVNSYLNNTAGLFLNHIFSNNVYILCLYFGAHFSFISGADKQTHI